MLTNFLSSVISRVKNEEGQGMVEYGLIIGLVAVGAIVVLAALGPAIVAKFQDILTALTPAA